LAIGNPSEGDVRPFRELRVWQEGHELTLEVYAATAQFPPDERFGITSQVRRAAYSIPLNVAEGSARSDAEFHQFLRISLGSASELEYALLLARDLSYLSPEAWEALNGRLLSIKRMLVAFMKTVNKAKPDASASTPAAELPDAKRQRPTANSQRPGAAP
jgi:four helix bundle protein